MPTGPHGHVGAGTHDPLWLLGRQWQLDELRHDAGATPIDVRVEGVVSPLTKLRGGSGTPAASGSFVIAEYLEGRLEWYDFEQGDGTLGVSGSATPHRAFRIAAPLDFAGMPNPRFWTFEDQSVRFDTLEMLSNPDAPPSPATLMVLDFALSYSDDWFLVPLKLDSWTVFEATTVAITDVFGEVTVAQPPDGRWNLFRLDALNALIWTMTPPPPPGNWFPLLPVVVGRLALGALWSARDQKPQGRLLTDLRSPRRLHQKEVPPEGVQVVRRWQSARAVDGSLHFWIGRSKTPRQTDIAPAVRFDVVDWK